jgi:PAS domain S-box-containing protein
MSTADCVRRSIPIKILLSILLVEAFLLACMGFFYSARFNQELDRRIAEKLTLPGVLMNQRAMPYDKVKDLQALSDLVQERVVDAFIFERGGKIFFTADSTREGMVYADFLTSEEQGAFGGDLRLARQFAFADGKGDHYIASISPLIANGVLLGGLYVRISADAIEQRKKDVMLFFCLGAILTIVFTTLISSFVVHRMIVPRIIDAARALANFAGGDFSARIVRPGAPDQLGEMMRQVNDLLEEIESNTRKLHSLNLIAEQYSRLESKEDIVRIAVEKAVQYLPLAVKSEGDGREAIFSLPLHGSPATLGGQTVQFVALKEQEGISPADTSYINALSGLMESAIERIEAFHRISEAEEKFRDLFLSALEGIYRTLPDGTIVDANPALAAMMGYESVEAMCAESSSIVDRYVRPGDREELMRRLQREEKLSDFEFMARRRDGTVFPVSLSARLVRDRSGGMQYVEGRMIDISERRQREQEKQQRLATEAAMEARLQLVEDLERKNRQLRETLDELKNTQLQLVQSEKMAVVGMTAGGVAHDLNNILAGVVSYPELLLATLPPDSTFRGPLEAIHASGRRAAAVVADLLTLAKGIARVKQHTVLHSLIDEYIRSVEFQAVIRDNPGVKVKVNDESRNVMISCSPVHIQKVIMNLVMNAIEAVAPHGGLVTVSTAHLQPPADDGMNGGGGYAVLEVADNGPGIPEENRDHIFEPFYTRKVMGKKGTGLGLTVVWNVVKEHGGKIDLESGATGTVFRVFLPAEVGPVREEAAEGEIDLQGEGRILVVDDEPLQRDIASEMLASFGYEVVTVPSGEAAIEYLRSGIADLIVLDMLMPPGLNGLETYREILRIRPGQKALIVSGFSESSDVKEAMRLGVGGFVKKPYAMNQIARAIKMELERQPVEA